MTIILLCLVAALAFANGANDNCKGVATLVGFGAARPRAALLYAMITTAIGAAVSFFLAGGLIKSFSTGLFATGTPLGTPFFIAVLAGAFGWVLFATVTGLPVSTTHAITGALLGAGLVAFGNTRIQWPFLGSKFAVPLAVSPLLSLAIVYVVAWPVVFVVSRLANRCVCVTQPQPALATAGAMAASPGTALAHLNVVVDYESNCDPATAVATTSTVANGIHWLSAGMVGFARGWNDAPKIAALALVALAANTNGMAIGFAIVTVAMAVGGLVAGRKVLETLSKKVTAMPMAESLTASLTTATLVSLASWNALPVSTTHVSTGAIVGAGLKNDPKKVKWSKVGEIVLSWLITLPVAALIAAAVKFAVR
jgi:PiT family inorganic phosphate transporter